jgi:hypothetical protein
LEHGVLSRCHVLDHHQLRNPLVANLSVHHAAWDDTDNMTAASHSGIGYYTHQPNLAATKHQVDAPSDEQVPYCLAALLQRRVATEV